VLRLSAAVVPQQHDAEPDESVRRITKYGENGFLLSPGEHDAGKILGDRVLDRGGSGCLVRASDNAELVDEPPRIPTPDGFTLDLEHQSQGKQPLVTGRPVGRGVFRSPRRLGSRPCARSGDLPMEVSYRGAIIAPAAGVPAPRLHALPTGAALAISSPPLVPPVAVEAVGAPYAGGCRVGSASRMPMSIILPSCQTRLLLRLRRRVFGHRAEFLTIRRGPRGGHDDPNVSPLDDESPALAGLSTVGAPRFELGTSSPPD
jgi:hypothetical protein